MLGHSFLWFLLIEKVPAREIKVPFPYLIFQSAYIWKLLGKSASGLDAVGNPALASLQDPVITVFDSCTRAQGIPEISSLADSRCMRKGKRLSLMHACFHTSKAVFIKPKTLTLILLTVRPVAEIGFVFH